MIEKKTLYFFEILNTLNSVCWLLFLCSPQFSTVRIYKGKEIKSAAYTSYYAFTDLYYTKLWMIW